MEEYFFITWDTPELYQKAYNNLFKNLHLFKDVLLCSETQMEIISPTNQEDILKMQEILKKERVGEDVMYCDRLPPESTTFFWEWLARGKKAIVISFGKIEFINFSIEEIKLLLAATDEDIIIALNQLEKSNTTIFDDKFEIN